MNPTLQESAPSRALSHAPANYIDGKWRELPGDAIASRNPARPDEIIWQGSPRIEHADEAVIAARRALSQWSATAFEERVESLRRWQKVTAKHAEALAQLITAEMGKTLAESRFEAKALASKVDITLDDYSINRVSDYDVSVSERRTGHCKFKPHGVMVVIGPFNFPAHLANGHFVPALLTGNTVIVKPSERTPAVGQMLAQMMDEVELPPGVFNVVQGAGDVAAHLANHEDVDGILFTGSWAVGRRILEANLDRPGRIIALEMGGNNPSVVLDDAHLKQAIIENVRSSFATTGQRCTCTRRIIVQSKVAEKFIPAFCKAASTLLIGPGESSENVFMGPLAVPRAIDEVLTFQSQLARSGGRVLLEASPMQLPPPYDKGYFITPGIVEVDSFTLDRDCEVFGPFVQLCVVDTLDEAIAQANATRYGLAASIFTTNQEHYQRFFNETRCGCINWNTGTAGASSKLPFGGLGHSGNNRPAAAFSVDYCAYPVANMIELSDGAAIPEGMQWDEKWI